MSLQGEKRSILSRSFEFLNLSTIKEDVEGEKAALQDCHPLIQEKMKIDLPKKVNPSSVPSNATQVNFEVEPCPYPMATRPDQMP